MSTMTDLKRYAAQTATHYPHLQRAIYELIQLAEDEIAGGGSESHEVELATQDIDFLIEGERG